MAERKHKYSPKRLVYKVKSSAFERVAEMWKPFGGIRYSYKLSEDGSVAYYVYSIRPRHSYAKSPRLKAFRNYIREKMQGRKFANYAEVQKTLTSTSREASAATKATAT